MRILIFILMLFFGTVAQAQTQAVPASPAQITLTFAPVVKKVSPAVVNIFTKRRVQVATPLAPFINDPIFRQFFGDQFGFEAPRERIVSSLGSGVIVSADGTVVTSHHVIKGSEQINVVLADRREFAATIEKVDAGSDLAVLKITDPGAPLPYVNLRDSDTLEVGDLVLALGNPFGVGQTVTQGIVSATSRAARGVSDYNFFIQTDAPINPGNSGGALVDIEGRLVGINTAIYSTSGGSVGIGFAIPSNMVKAVLSGKVKGTEVIRPFFGVTAQNVTPDIAAALGMEIPQGALIKEVEKASPAETAGLKAGDVILSVDGKPVTDAQSLSFREAISAIGNSVAIDLLRGGKPLSILITPAETAPTQTPQIVRLSGDHPLNGMGVADITPAVAQQLKLPAQKGVVVAQGAKKRLNVQPGDLVLAVNGTAVTSVAQLQKLLLVPNRTWEITFQRGASISTLTVIR